VKKKEAKCELLNNQVSNNCVVSISIKKFKKITEKRWRPPKKKNAPYTSKQGIWVGHQNGQTSTLFLIRSSNGISPGHRSIVSAIAT